SERWPPASIRSKLKTARRRRKQMYENSDRMLKLYGRRIHPFLVVLPFGLLLAAAAFDVMYLFTRAATWALVSYWTTTAGLITGIIAAIPGLYDWLTVRAGTRAQTTATTYGAAYLVALALFGISWLMRWNAGAAGHLAPSVGPVVLS